MKKHFLTTARTAVRTESRPFLAALLALLCLLFAVNYFLIGPGSDGGSGLGGTGKFGGESGLGGTGKTPDSGPSFKLGANDRDDSLRSSEDFIVPDHDAVEAVDIPEQQLADTDSTPAFDVSTLRLTPEKIPALSRDNSDLNGAVDKAIAGLVAKIELPGSSSVDMDSELARAASGALVSSQDVLAGLMLAESESELLANRDRALQVAARTRISMPSRPERPDRFSSPVRITPVQRVNIPSPPPVRPMRTLSTMLNK